MTTGSLVRREPHWTWFKRAVIGVVFFLRMWALMIVLGVSHSYDEQIPAFSLITCGYLLLAFEIAIFGHELRQEFDK